MSHVAFPIFRTCYIACRSSLADSLLLTRCLSYTTPRLYSSTRTKTTTPRKSRTRNRLSAPVIDQVFNRELDLLTGNKVLYELHKRRVTGSLVDLGTYFKDLNLTDYQSQRALQWLRQQYPVDEATAGERYAEREMAAHKAAISQGYIAKAKKWGLVSGKASSEKSKSIADDSFIGEKTKQWRERREARIKEREEANTAAKAANEEKAEKRAIQLAQEQEMLGMATIVPSVRSFTHT
jgi:rhomboid-like protein